MAYPSSLDSFSNPQGTTLVAPDDHALQHRTEGSAIVAVETKVGLSSSTPATDKILIGSGAGTSAWGSVWNNATLGTPRVTGGTISGALLGTNTLQGGTANNVTLGTPAVVNLINGVGTVNPISFGVAISPTTGTIVDSVGTLIVNAQAAQIYYSAQGTSAGNRTIGTPLNPTAGQSLTYAFKTSGSANGTLVWLSCFRFSQDSGTVAIGTGTSWNYYTWRYNGIDNRWDSQGQINNIT